MENTQNRTLTFGERAVGLTFNPGNNPQVDEIKILYAQIIDLLDAMTIPEAHDKNRHIKIAITDAETAQMRAVKAITWN